MVWNGNFCVLWKLRCVTCFPGNCLVRGCFAEVRGHVMFCWSRCLRESVMFEKSISRTQQRVNDGFALVPLVMICWSSLIFACCDFIERNTWSTSYGILDAYCHFGFSWFLLDQVTATDSCKNTTNNNQGNMSFPDPAIIIQQSLSISTQLKHKKYTLRQTLWRW